MDEDAFIVNSQLSCQPEIDCKSMHRAGTPSLRLCPRTIVSRTGGHIEECDQAPCHFVKTNFPSRGYAPTRMAWTTAGSLGADFTCGQSTVASRSAVDPTNLGIPRIKANSQRQLFGAFAEASNRQLLAGTCRLSLLSSVVSRPAAVYVPLPCGCNACR